MKTTQIGKVLTLLSDGKFHSNVELCQVGGWRFGAHISRLKSRGYIFEKEGRRAEDKGHVEYWKLTSNAPVITVVENGKATQEGFNIGWIDEEKIEKLHEEMQERKSILSKIFNLWR